MNSPFNKNDFKSLKKLADKYDLELFFLFGSRAKNKSKSNSDYDFAYLRRKTFTLKQEEEFYFSI